MQTFLVFGLTGDLMKKKGIPALFALWEEKKLPEDFRIIGLSRKTWNTKTIKQHIDTSVGSEVPQTFADLFSIFTGEGENLNDILKLKKEFSIDASNLFTYLCISPELYAGVIKNLGEAELLQQDSTTILIEKPFGRDLESAKSLQSLLLQYVHEEQIYRIDHFLAKEAVLNLSNLESEEILSIEVYLNEALGVEKRGAMYDPVGAFRDVAQNHLLESAAAALGARTTALTELHILSPEEIKTNTERSQYEGYQSIDGVALGSQTETHFKVESYIERAGKKIPLILESGKRMPWRREVVVTTTSGKVVIPFESGTNEYETLFAEAFANDRHRFVSMQEVEALWRFTDPIENEWRQNSVPLASYKPEPL
ncbi:MAG: hypothetical protein V4436_03405 [Patescibacteria group bacterium]